MGIVRNKHKTFFEFRTVDGDKRRVYLGGANYETRGDDYKVALSKLSKEPITGLNLYGYTQLPKANYVNCLFGGASFAGGSTVKDCDLSHQLVSISGRVEFHRTRLVGTTILAADGEIASFVPRECDMERIEVDGRVTSPYVIHVAPGSYLDGFHFFAYVSKDNVVHIRAGCRDKTLTEALKYWDAKKSHRQEIRAACLFIKNIAAIRRWRSS